MRSQFANLPERIRLCKFFKAYYASTRVIECEIYKLIPLIKCKKCKKQRY